MLAGVDDCRCGEHFHAAMAWTGSASHEDGSKLLSQETAAVLKLLGMFLTAMCELSFFCKTALNLSFPFLNM